MIEVVDSAFDIIMNVVSHFIYVSLELAKPRDAKARACSVSWDLQSWNFCSDNSSSICYLTQTITLLIKVVYHNIFPLKRLTTVRCIYCMCPGDSDVTAMEYHQTPVRCARAVDYPGRWSRDDVSRWLKWCVDEYGLSSDLPDRFVMNGLCLSNRFMLTKRPRLPNVVVDKGLRQDVVSTTVNAFWLIDLLTDWREDLDQLRAMAHVWCCYIRTILLHFCIELCLEACL